MDREIFQDVSPLVEEEKKQKNSNSPFNAVIKIFESLPKVVEEVSVVEGQGGVQDDGRKQHVEEQRRRELGERVAVGALQNI